MGRPPREVRHLSPTPLRADTCSWLRYYLAANSLTVIGKPSASLADKLEKETNALVSKRVSELGESGLKKLQDNIEAAQKANDVEVPQDILSGFKIPDVDGIRWIDVKSAGAGKNNGKFDNEVQARLAKDDVELPYFVQFERESQCPNDPGPTAD